MPIVCAIIALFLIIAGWIIYYFTCTNQGRKEDMSGKLESTQTLSEMTNTMLSIDREQANINTKLKVIKNGQVIR